MVATVIVGMLCVHLLCFAVMFWLISTRLQGQKLGMDAFAVGNAMLGAAYVLQLLGGPPGWNALSVVNHTLTLCVPLVYWVGALRFFGRSTPLLKPLFLLGLGYAAAQVLVQWLAGSVARYAMLSFASAAVFLAMTVAVVQAMRSMAKDLRVEMALFALLIGGLCVLNAIKGVLVARGGLEALGMEHRFQVVFYIYMSFLATVLAPSMIWLVLRRLTDALRATAQRDPLTQLLNRRGLLAGLEGHFRSRSAAPARLLMLDIDHFKQVNDAHGHAIGDAVLRVVAQAVKGCLRPTDLMFRFGGEEFTVIAPELNEANAMTVAERMREAVERVRPLGGHERKLPRVTISVGCATHDGHPDFMHLLKRADAALYAAKQAGRNRVVAGSATQRHTA